MSLDGRKTSLRHDLVLYGLPAVEARRLRDALARAQVVVDVSADDDVVRIPAAGNRTVAVEGILAIVRDWAVRARLARVPVAYGGRLYALTVAAARMGAVLLTTEERPSSARSITVGPPLAAERPPTPFVAAP